MKRTAGYIALAMAFCIGAGAAEATLIGDDVIVRHYEPDGTTVSIQVGVSSPSTTVTADDSDTVIAYGGYPYGYKVNVGADTILVDFDYLFDASGTWWDSYTTVVFNPDTSNFEVLNNPVAFNGLGVSGLDDSSGNPLQGVTVDTNMAGWNTSMLSFGSDYALFDWKGLSFNTGTYFNATLDFSGSTSVPEPSTLLLIGGGLACFGAWRRLSAKS